MNSRGGLKFEQGTNWGLLQHARKGQRGGATLIKVRARKVAGGTNQIEHGHTTQRKKKRIGGGERREIHSVSIPKQGKGQVSTLTRKRRKGMPLLENKGAIIQVGIGKGQGTLGNLPGG